MGKYSYDDVNYNDLKEEKNKKEASNENKKDPKKTTKGVASLTLGLVCLVFNWFWYIALPTGILAIVLGAKAHKHFTSKAGKAGVVLGIIGLSLMALVYGGLTLLILVNA